MSESPQLPGIGKPTKTYLDAWEQFGGEIFSIEDLHKQLLRESTEPEKIPSQDTLNSRLARAAVAGVVGSYGDRRYDIRLDPKAAQDRWEEVAIEHVGRVMEEISESYDERMAASEDGRDQGDQFVGHNDETYLRTFVGHNTDVKEDLEGYIKATFEPDNHAGLVLESWTTVAEAANNLSSELSNDEKMESINFLYRFEIDDEELTTDEDNDSIFRVYLRETRFS